MSNICYWLLANIDKAHFLLPKKGKIWVNLKKQVNTNTCLNWKLKLFGTPFSVSFTDIMINTKTPLILQHQEKIRGKKGQMLSCHTSVLFWLLTSSTHLNDNLKVATQVESVFGAIYSDMMKVFLKPLRNIFQTVVGNFPISGMPKSEECMLKYCYTNVPREWCHTILPTRYPADNCSSAAVCLYSRSPETTYLAYNTGLAD